MHVFKKMGIRSLFLTLKEDENWTYLLGLTALRSWFTMPRVFLEES